MGLFVLDLEKPQTKKSLVTAAVGNLNLYLEELNGRNGNDYDHLLTIADGYLKQAINDDGLSKYEGWSRDDII